MVKYSDEQKESALLLVKEIGISRASRELHIADQTLRKWRNHAEANKPDEEQVSIDEAINNPEIDPAEQDPPVEKVETIFPDPQDAHQAFGEECAPGKEAKRNGTASSDQEKLIAQLKAENSELLLRIGLLKKSLVGIVEAVASL